MAIVVKATSTASVSGATLALTAPASAAAGDLLVLVVANDGSSFGGVATWTLPAGFSQVAGSPIALTGATFDTMVVATKVADGTESALNVSGDRSLGAVGAVLRLSGHDATSPIEALSSNSVSGTAVPLAVPHTSLTTTTANELVLQFDAFFSNFNGTYSYTPAGGASAVASILSGTSLGLYVGGLTQASAGATGTLQSSITTNGAGSSINAIGAMLAIKPAAAPVITGHPSSATGSIGSNATFSVSASASAGTLAYQWQISFDARATWSDITGFTDSTLLLAGLAAPDNGASVRCVVTDANGSVTSAPAWIWVRDLLSGQGAKLTGWATQARFKRGTPLNLPRGLILAHDRDTLDAAIWTSWFLAAPTAPPLTPMRALVLVGGRLTQVTDAMIGTGLNPVSVLPNGWLSTAGGGVPLVWRGDRLGTLAATESLLI